MKKTVAQSLTVFYYYVIIIRLTPFFGCARDSCTSINDGFSRRNAANDKGVFYVSL